MRGLRRLAPLLAGLVTIGALTTVQTFVPDPFARLQMHVFDTLQRAHPRSDDGTGSLVIDVDEDSLARHGQWPWSRSTLAELVRSLQDMGASAIALDILLAEPDRTSPSRLGAEWRRTLAPGQDKPAEALADYDRELADTIARGRVATGFGLLSAPNGRRPHLTRSIATIGGDPVRTVHGFAGAIPSLPLFDRAASGQGSFTIAAGRDEIIRRLPLIMALRGELVPSLALEALRVAEDEDALRVRAERNGGPDGALLGYTVRVGAFDVPLAQDGTLWLHHGHRHPDATIPAWMVLDAAHRTALAGRVRDRLVLVGTSAVGLGDLRPTPLTAFEPGVNIHANAIDQIRAGAYLTRPAWSKGAELVAAAVASLVLALLVTTGGVTAAALAAVAAATFALAGAWWSFSAWRHLVDPSPIVIALALTFVATTLARYLVAERDAAKLRAAFGHYLSPHLVAQLARDPSRLKLGGELREMTFLFTDLEGFTSFTESVAPDVLVRTLNRYLDGVCGIAMDHGGTIDKIVGDAVHLIFNAPIDQADHATRAVRCALAIDAFASAFAAHELAATGRSFGITRIGVNTGRAVVGNFGGTRRFDYTAHGDAINTAARLEAANKTLGTRICVARSTVDATEGCVFRPVGSLLLKGKSVGVEVYSPLPEGAPELSWASLYGDVFARLARGEADAPDALLDLHARYPDDPLLAFHARRAAAGERSVRMAA